MANTRISQLTASGAIADGDLLPIVDISDTTDSADGTTRKITKANLTTGLAPTASPTFTGTVTIPTPFTLGATSVLPTGTELNYVDGVTSAIQTQLDTKSPTASPTFTGTVTIPTPFTLGGVSVLPTGTELNFVDGVTSAIQTQIDAKQASDAGLTSLAGL